MASALRIRNDRVLTATVNMKFVPRACVMVFDGYPTILYSNYSGSSIQRIASLEAKP